MAPKACSRTASTVRLAPLLVVALAGILCAGNAAAAEIYRWTDADGVMHFSDRPPTSDQQSHATMTVDNPPPSDYDPNEDRYNLSATAARTQALRDERSQARNAQSPSTSLAAQSTQPQQAYGEDYGDLPGYRRPDYGRPGARPPRPGHPDRPARPETEPPPATIARPKRRSNSGR